MTTENNKLIAEFLGAKYNQEEKLLYFDSIYQKKGKNFFYDYELCYHSDWNWLMQVVEKIKPLNKNVNHHYLRLMNMTLSEALNIDYLYSNVVEFIKWYNENKI
jgi:hypothetical protein